MASHFRKIIDRFVPEAMLADESDALMARTFVMLHLIGPAMGHAVTVFLAYTATTIALPFWTIEALVLSFFLIPMVLKRTGSLDAAAIVSVQMLVFLSLFGSYFFGGISSPFLPWFLIAMVLGFFFLANRPRLVIAGVGAQLFVFFATRALAGEFPAQIATENLHRANLVSISAALIYMTILSLYYERVMRISAKLEEEAIDQRHKIETLRNAMEVAEEASKRKSIFLAKMSHQLRTPLNAVIGYTEMLRDTFEDQPGAQRKMDDLNRIHKAGRHLLALVDNVVDLSSIEANRIEVTTEPVAIAALIDEVVATASPLIKKRENNLIVRIQSDLGIYNLDALKLRQSILNLLSNAARFTTKGVIVLSVTREVGERGDKLVINVEDNGIGIARNALERIFADFSQADQSTRNNFGGTGLGLALTKRFCEMMGGTIRVNSEPNIGSIFSIAIPVVRDAPQNDQRDVNRVDTDHRDINNRQAA
jgi:signal transduction histidine kinase